MSVATIVKLEFAWPMITLAEPASRFAYELMKLPTAESWYMIVPVIPAKALPDYPVHITMFPTALFTFSVVVPAKPNVELGNDVAPPV